MLHSLEPFLETKASKVFAITCLLFTISSNHKPVQITNVDVPNICFSLSLSHARAHLACISEPCVKNIYQVWLKISEVIVDKKAEMEFSRFYLCKKKQSKFASFRSEGFDATNRTHGATFVVLRARVFPIVHKFN